MLESGLARRLDSPTGDLPGFFMLVCPEMSFSEESLEPSQDLLHSGAFQLLDRLAKSLDRGPDLALLQVGVAQEAHGDGSVEGILHPFQPAPAFLDSLLRLAEGGVHVAEAP